MKRYNDLFNGITDAIEDIETVCGNQALPLEALRSLGMIMETLKKVQIAAEEQFIGDNVDIQ